LPSTVFWQQGQSALVWDGAAAVEGCAALGLDGVGVWAQENAARAKMIMAVILNFMMNLLFEFCEFAAAGHCPF